VRRGAIRRRLAIRRGVTVALFAVVAWLAFSSALGAVARSRDLCTGCHAMEPYAAASHSSTHEGVECITCHKTSGTLGILPDGIALQRRTLRSMMGVTPQVASVDDAACLKCHARIRSGVSVARGIRVQHAEFIDRPCGECHGGLAHRIENRRYVVPEMDSCMACHTASSTELSGCTMCHSTQSQRERRETDTSWRVTHGPTWKTTHGMGELDTCRTCHPAPFCVRCHGTPLPHTPDWSQVHGKGLAPQTREQCATCHEKSWCDACHGIEMPHPAGFLPRHGPITQTVGDEACARCHALAGCEDCHFRSSHPNLPGVGMGHGDTK
jgi:trimethylamine-N-oxide reductase cytochrome c-type subunit TorC